MASNARWIRSAAALVVALFFASGAIAQDGAADSAASVSTASYPLFPIEGSDVNAQLQVAESAEGGARLVLTVVGVDEGGDYRAAVYEGDCGPDRPVALELAPVGLGNDPFVSSTETQELSFAALTEGDHFIYLFEGDTIDRPDTFGLDGDALACGEVGAGAIR